MDGNKISLTASEEKILNKQPLGISKTGCRNKVLEDTENKLEYCMVHNNSDIFDVIYPRFLENYTSDAHRNTQSSYKVFIRF